MKIVVLRLCLAGNLSVELKQYTDGFHYHRPFGPAYYSYKLNYNKKGEPCQVWYVHGTRIKDNDIEKI